MSIITTFESQCRALTSAASSDENASRFLVGTLSPNEDNTLYLFEYKDDSDSLAKVSFKFPYGEIWHLSTSTRYPEHFASVIGDRGRFKTAIFKLPEEFKGSIEDDYGLSESQLEKVYQPSSSTDTDLVRQSLWHPDDGDQLLTCDNGTLQFWDINQEQLARSFSLMDAVHRELDLDFNNLSLAQVSDLRWSSLFNCSVVAAAIGSKVHGIDTRVPDSNTASICWLIEDKRCNRIRTIDFNPNSQYYIASGGDNCRANFWDLRNTASPVLTLQAHTHWIWSIRYNPFHDQLVLSSGSDARVVIMRAQSIASEPYGQIADDDSYIDDTENSVQSAWAEKIDRDPGKKEDDTHHQSTPVQTLKDDIVKVYEEHDDSVYSVEWASDPWVFASLGFESRLVINKVPKQEKFNTLF